MLISSGMNQHALDQFYPMDPTILGSMCSLGEGKGYPSNARSLIAISDSTSQLKATKADRIRAYNCISNQAGRSLIPLIAISRSEYSRRGNCRNASTRHC